MNSLSELSGDLSLNKTIGNSSDGEVDWDKMFSTYTNHTKRDNSDDKKEELIKNIAVICSYSLIFVLSLFGNLLVCYVILSKRQMRSITNYYIVNLSFSDLSMTLFNMPFSVARLLLNDWPFGSVLCQFFPFVQVTSVYVSTFTMTIIALDRYQALVHPLRRRLSAVIPIFYMIPAIWLLSMFLSIPHAIYNRVEKIDIKFIKVISMTRCRVILPEPQATNRKLLTIITFSTQYMVPLSIACVAYMTIGYYIWKRGGLGDMTEQQVANSSRIKRKTLTMLILVLSVFAICWLPLNLYNIWIDFGKSPKINTKIFLMCHWFGMSSVCYNPFIYCWRNNNFREGAKNFFRCCFCCQIGEASSQNNLQNLKTQTEECTRTTNHQITHRMSRVDQTTQEDIAELDENEVISKEERVPLNDSHQLENKMSGNGDINSKNTNANTNSNSTRDHQKLTVRWKPTSSESNDRRHESNETNV